MVNSISFLGSFCELFWLSSTVTLGSHSCRKFNAGSFVVLNNFSKLQALLVFLVFRSFRFSFFDVIALGLNTMEANSLHAFHVTIWLSTTLRKILHKTDHSFITFHVECVLTFCAQFVQPSVIFIMDKVAIVWVLKGILKVRNESKTVIKLDEERLSVDGRPFTSDLLGSNTSSGWALALNGLYLVVVHQIDFPNILLGKMELMILIDKL